MTPGIIIGTVGWDGVDDHFFPGENDNDGCTLVRVQMFEGRDNTKRLKPTVGQGMQLVCQIANALPVPPKGARCYVAIPDGMWHSPGAGVIFATVGGGNERNRNINAGDATLAPKGDDVGQALVLTKTDGTITLHTTDNNLSNGNSVFFRVLPTAFQFVAPWGRLIFDATGVHWTTKSGARFDMGGIILPSPLDTLGSYVKLTAGMVKADAPAVFLGAGSGHVPVVTTIPTPVMNTAGVLTIPVVPPAVSVPQPTLLGSPVVWASLQ